MKINFKYQKWDKTLILEGEHEKITFFTEDLWNYYCIIVTCEV